MLSLLWTHIGLTKNMLVAECTGRRLVVKRPGVLSKVPSLVWGVFFPLPIKSVARKRALPLAQRVVCLLLRSKILPS